MGLRDKLSGAYSRVANGIGRTYEGDKIPKRTKWIYSVSGIGRDAAYAIVATFLLIFVQDAGYLSRDLGEYTAMMGVITGLTIGYRIFDGLNDPLVGVIIEKCHFKTGKYKPFIFIGSFLNIFTILALFMGPHFFHITGWGFVGWFAVFYLLWGMTFTLNDISFWSMLPSMSSKEQERAKVTSLVLIFSYIGSFLASFGIPKLKPYIGNDCYWIMAIVIASLFLIGQAAVFFGCKEHKREEDSKKERPKFKDMFVMLKRNKYARTMIITFFCYFLATAIMSSLMQNVFWISIGYNPGSDMFAYFNLVNTFGIVTPMIIMPIILKKFKIKKLFQTSLVAMLALMLVFFFYGNPINGTYISPVPIANNGLNVSYAICMSLIIYFIYVAQGCVYNTMIIMLTNTIEYNEYKFGKRQESIIFSMRPLSAKLGSSLQQAVYFISLLSTGLNVTFNAISSANNKFEFGEIDAPKRDQLISEALGKVSASQIWQLKIWAVVVPIAILCICYLLVWRCYHIDEKMYESMLKEINKRHKSIKA